MHHRGVLFARGDVDLDARDNAYICVNRCDSATVDTSDSSIWIIDGDLADLGECSTNGNAEHESDDVCISIARMHNKLWGDCASDVDWRGRYPCGDSY
jgi:hypothetical protein